jgi:uncharacterized protein YjeT (DUF2065 family)
MLALTVERYTALTMLIVGLSHVIQPGMWCHLFVQMGRARIAAVAIGMFTLPTGLVLLLTHNDWALRPTLIVTILGWGQAIKGSLYLLAPHFAQERCLAMEGAERQMRLAGLILLALGIPVAIASFGFS